jgi:hypothetical protein
MKTLSTIPLDVKQLVALSYLDASSFVSLSCTSREWNLVLRSLCQWSEKVHRHVNTRASEIWKDMFAPLQRVRVQMHCWDVSWNECDAAVRFERDAALYKNGRAWLKLQEDRHAEMKKIVLLESAWNHHVWTVAVQEERLADVSSFSARAFDAARVRVAELDAAIARTSISWRWIRTKTEIETVAMAKINKFQTTEAYLKWFLMDATQVLNSYVDAFRGARTSVNPSIITFFHCRRAFLQKVVEMCERELLVLSNNN